MNFAPVSFQGKFNLTPGNFTLHSTQIPQWQNKLDFNIQRLYTQWNGTTPRDEQLSMKVGVRLNKPLSEVEQTLTKKGLTEVQTIVADILTGTIQLKDLQQLAELSEVAKIEVYPLRAGATAK